MPLVTAAISGLLFGLGILLSGTANPKKVIGFLDIAGLWDPSLGFVMGGAILVAFPAFRFIRKKKESFYHMPFDLPVKTKVDYPLIIGSALFGIGWGLGGICPGPGLVTAILGIWKAVVFIAAMFTGMFIYQKLYQK